MTYDPMAALIADTIGRLPGGVVRFFEPTPAFLDGLVGFPPVDYYDVGAGAGQLAAALKRRGQRVVALDLAVHQRPVYGVQLADAGTYTYAPDSCAVIARPCHGDFAERAARRALACGAWGVVYVGFAKNLRGDLGPLARRAVRVREACGDEGESAWLVQKTSKR